MAMKLDKEIGSRTDGYRVNPDKVLVKEEDRARHFPPTEEDLHQLAMSLDTYGQQNAILVRKLTEDLVQVVDGSTRTLAARKLRAGFIWKDPETGEEKLYHDPNFVLRADFTACNEEEAFVSAVVANRHRFDVSVIDRAHNHRRLRERYGYTNAKIARLENDEPGKVGKMEKLLLLSKDEQYLVHVGALSFQGALDLLDLPEDKRKEALEKAKGENGKVNGAVIRSIAREEALNGHSDEEIPTATAVVENPSLNGEAPTEQPAPEEPAKKGGGKTKKLSMGEWRNEVEVIGGDPNPNIQKIAQVITLVLEGKRKGSALVRVLREVVK